MLNALIVSLVSGYTSYIQMDSLSHKCVTVSESRQAITSCLTVPFLYLASFHLGFLLAALPAVGLELGEAELPEQVTGAAQQVARKAQVPACLRGNLGSVC